MFKIQTADDLGRRQEQRSAAAKRATADDFEKRRRQRVGEASGTAGDASLGSASAGSSSNDAMVQDAAIVSNGVQPTQLQRPPPLPFVVQSSVCVPRQTTLAAAAFAAPVPKTGAALVALAGAMAQPAAVAKARAPLVQGTIQRQADAFAFLQPLAGQWETVTIDGAFVPKIGSDQLPAPKPRTARTSGEILAIKGPCGSKKSVRFRQFMKEKIFAVNPTAHVLLLSANILYGTNLMHDLQQAGFPKVGFYREGIDLSACQTVLCSLESLHHMEGQRFDVVLINEVRTIARLVGGGTMQDFNKVYLMRELCANTTQVVVCDADLDFKIDPSEPQSLVHDFLKEIAPDPACTQCNWH